MFCCVQVVLPVVLLSVVQVILNSMHKYLPCMKIMCQSDGMSQSFTFPETSFIAVTAYQSTGVSSHPNGETELYLEWIIGARIET